MLQVPSMYQFEGGHNECMRHFEVRPGCAVPAPADLTLALLVAASKRTMLQRLRGALKAANAGAHV
jgi:hypothetical protein